MLSQSNHNPPDGGAYFTFRAIHTPTFADLRYRKVEGEASDELIVALTGFAPYTLWNCEEWHSLMALLKPKLAECQAHQEEQRRLELERQNGDVR